MIKVSILKRIEALEQLSKRGTEPPSLIMIHFDEGQRKWKAVEYFPHSRIKGSVECRTRTSLTEKLEDYYFPADFNGRVILDTFASIEPDIYENLFCFDMDELREGQAGEIAIQSISEMPDGTMAAINIRG